MKRVWLVTAVSIWILMLDSSRTWAETPKTGAGTVAYPDLKSKKVSVPYGEPFTVTGDTKDVQLSGGALVDLMQAQSVAGNYSTGDGNKGDIPSAAITGTTWQAAIGKLNADTSVTINFQFTGILSSKVQEDVLSAMVADPAYQAAVGHFVAAAQGRPSAVQMQAATLLAQAATDVFTAILNGKGLTPKDPAGLKTTLGAAMPANIEPIFNLNASLAELRNPSFHYDRLVDMPPAQFEALSPEQLSEKLKGVADFSRTGGDAAQTKLSVERFLTTYKNDVAVINTALKAAIFIGTSALAVGNDQQSDIVSDLKKYAGFDVGALYAYRLSELRSFAMVHIYFGPVQLKTDAPPSDPGKAGWLKQRLSLTFGVALKDLSGSSKSKVSSENAFAYGVGFRLNKYFRLSAGGLLYRTTLPAANGSTSPASGTLRQEFFVGPSIDVTALPALQSIFAKSKSN